MSSVVRPCADSIDLHPDYACIILMALVSNNQQDNPICFFFSDDEQPDIFIRLLGNFTLLPSDNHLLADPVFGANCHQIRRHRSLQR